MKLVLASIDQVWEDKEANKKTILSCLEFAKENSADLIIFPEMTLTGFSFNKKIVPEEIDSSSTIEFFKKISSEFSINIIFGVVIKSDAGILNNWIAITKTNGDCELVYAKNYLFPLSLENETFTPGSRSGEICFSGYSIGCSICYDLRFPEFFRSDIENKHAFINIANWPKKRIDHWNCLLKARAIENQIFMIGVNRIGVDGNNIEYEESSKIFDSLGNEIAPQKIQKFCKFYSLDFSNVIDTRKAFPFLKDRKKFQGV